MKERDSPDGRRSRPKQWRLWTPPAGLAGLLLVRHWLSHRLPVAVPSTAQQARALIWVGGVQALRLLLHLRLKYLWVPWRSPEPEAQMKLNECFGFNVLFHAVWIGGAVQISTRWSTEPAVFILCASLYYFIAFAGDWTSEAAIAAKRQLGRDAVRNWRPVARFLARGERANKRNVPATSWVPRAVESRDPEVTDVSLASGFVLVGALILYLGMLISAGQTWAAAERHILGGNTTHASAPPHHGPITVTLPGPPLEKPVDLKSDDSGGYTTHCFGNPGDGGTVAVQARFYAAVLGAAGHDGIGGNETGCLTVAIREPHHPGVWLALGYCGQDLRGLVAVGPGWPVQAIIQQPAQIAASFARKDELLGVSARYDVGSGDMVVLATTHGLVLVIRPLLSNGPAPTGSRWCDEFADENVVYTTVPAGLVPGMIDLETVRRDAGQSFLWPAEDTSEHPAGHDFTFHTTYGETSVARASCVSDTRCVLRYRRLEWRSGASPKATLGSILGVMPLPPAA